jgi:tetratricopeptide (TPR) repeat protein
MKTRMLFLIVLVSVVYTYAQEKAQTAFNEGVKHLKAEDFVEAEKKFSEAIRYGKAPNGVKMAYIFKGFALNGQGKYADAVPCFTKAAELDPLDPATYADRGKTYSYLKKYDRAIIDFNKVLSLDSTGKQAEGAFYYLGRIKMLQYEYKDAIKFFDRLLQFAPTDSEGYFLRGVSKSNLMDIDGSISDYDSAIKYNPNYMEAYANRGVQKINKLPVSEKIGKKIECQPDACPDLLKAKQMGDKSVDDMIFLYCSGCK